MRLLNLLLLNLFSAGGVKPGGGAPGTDPRSTCSNPITKFYVTKLLLLMGSIYVIKEIKFCPENQQNMALFARLL